MNRRLLDRHLRTHDAKYERRYRCEGCAWFFAIIEEPGANIHPDKGVADAWCPCKPWDIRAVHVGMKLPQGWVLCVDRENHAVEVASELGAERPWSRLDFSEVSPPQ